MDLEELEQLEKRLETGLAHVLQTKVSFFFLKKKKKSLPVN